MYICTQRRITERNIYICTNKLFACVTTTLCTFKWNYYVVVGGRKGHVSFDQIRIPQELLIINRMSRGDVTEQTYWAHNLRHLQGGSLK